VETGMVVRSARRGLMEHLVVTEQENGVAIVTINNPKARNALSRRIIVELSASFDALSSDKACRAIVLTGAEKHLQLRRRRVGNER
jgi:enoyl-CoA hydratase/carnithine racemase